MSKSPKVPISAAAAITSSPAADKKNSRGSRRGAAAASPVASPAAVLASASKRARNEIVETKASSPESPSKTETPVKMNVKKRRLGAKTVLYESDDVASSTPGKVTWGMFLPVRKYEGFDFFFFFE